MIKVSFVHIWAQSQLFLHLLAYLVSTLKGYQLRPRNKGMLNKINHIFCKLSLPHFSVVWSEKHNFLSLSKLPKSFDLPFLKSIGCSSFLRHAFLLRSILFWSKIFGCLEKIFRGGRGVKTGKCRGGRGSKPKNIGRGYLNEKFSRRGACCISF